MASRQEFGLPINCHIAKDSEGMLLGHIDIDQYWVGLKRFKKFNKAPKKDIVELHGQRGSFFRGKKFILTPCQN